jgi:hypothetical protein
VSHFRPVDEHAELSAELFERPELVVKLDRMPSLVFLTSEIAAVTFGGRSADAINSTP